MLRFLFVQDMPEKCNFTNLLCNESRLLKEDKIIILNIGNELRNRVAGGTFRYLNLQHDPVTDMNKLVRFIRLARIFADLFDCYNEERKSIWLAILKFHQLESFASIGMKRSLIKPQ